MVIRSEERVAQDRRECHWLSVVTHYDTEPRLQATRDPAALPSHEVRQMDQYSPSVNAASLPHRVREGRVPDVREGKGHHEA